MALSEIRTGREAYVAGYSASVTASVLTSGSLGAVANAVGRARFESEGDVVRFHGIGRTRPADIRIGQHIDRFSLDLEGISGGGTAGDGAAVLDWAVRATTATGALPWVFLALGVSPAAEYSYYLTNAKVDRLTLGLRPGEALRGTLEGQGGEVTVGSISAAPSNIGGNPLFWHDARITLASGAGGGSWMATKGFIGIDLTLANNLAPIYTLGGASGTVGRQFARAWDALKEGTEAVEGTIESLYEPGTFAAQNASMGTFDATLRAVPQTVNATYPGIDIILNAVKVNAQQLEVPEGAGPFAFTYPFVAGSMSIISVTAT